MMSKLFTAAVAVVCVAAAVRAANVDADAEVDLSAVVAADTSTWAHLSQTQLMRLSVFGNSGCQTIDVAGFDYNKGFAEFCKKYGKVYKAKTYALRFATWKASYNCIAYKNSNAASLNFFQRPNHLHDHTQAEFLASLGTRTMDAVGTPATAPVSNTGVIPALTSINGDANPHGEGQAQKFRQIHGKAGGAQGVLAPAAEESFAELSAAQSTTDPMSGQSFDWRTKGVVNPVGYQRTCGNCWSWTAATVAEAAWKIGGNNLRKVSVQQITDCSPAPCNGCSGGVPGEGLSNVNMFGGFCADSEYPFQGRQTKCNGNCKVIVKLSEVLKNYRPSDENQLFDMLKIGPVSVGLVASPSSFMSYGGGVYDDVKCNAADVKINHGMTIVGYGTDPKKGDYWILKNQWAASWGEQGYMRLKRGVNQCKVVTQWVTAKSTLASVFGINDGPAPGAPAAPVAPLSPCQTKPDARGVVVRGTCQDVISCTDNGGSPTPGLCPGAANIQCCLNKAALTPDVTPANTAVPCTARHPTKGVMTGGTCIDAGICNAATNLPVRGACAGPANIQCCLPRQ